MEATISFKFNPNPINNKDDFNETVKKVDELVEKYKKDPNVRIHIEVEV